MDRAWRHAFIICVLLAGCGSPTEPTMATLATGRWTSGNACLSVSDSQCDLAAGCGHGQFPRPAIRRDGTFDVDGTYRIEVGPASVNPAPPAHFSGSMVGSTLNLTVTPTRPMPPASYSMSPSAATGGCPIPCV